MTSEKTFISYCWTSPEHETWVLNLAEELVSAGVDVILDKWELKEGHDLIGFMERMVTDESVKKVIMICDKLYAEKADGRSGGVGTETQIISQKVYKNQNQDKFVALIVEKDQDGKPYLPTYYNSRKYIDLSSDSDYSKNYETLLRWIYNRPLHVKPEIGKMPAFLAEDNSVKISSGITYRRAIQSIKDFKASAHLDVDSYYGNILDELKKFKMTSGRSEEEILDNLECLLPLRNEISRVFDLIARYNPSDEMINVTTSFFEKLCNYFYPDDSTNSYYQSDYDNFKFIAHESFLLLISSFVRNNRFEECGKILQKKYYIHNKMHSDSKLFGYGIIYNHLESLERINKKNETRWISYHSNLLKERCESENEKFSYLIQADLICYIINAFKFENNYRNEEYWYPFTLIYHGRLGRSLEAFERAADKNYFEQFKNIFSSEGNLFFDELARKVRDGRIKEPKFDYESVNILYLINYEKLNTL